MKGRERGQRRSKPGKEEKTRGLKRKKKEEGWLLIWFLPWRSILSNDNPQRQPERKKTKKNGWVGVVSSAFYLERGRLLPPLASPTESRREEASEAGRVFEHLLGRRSSRIYRERTEREESSFARERRPKNVLHVSLSSQARCSFLARSIVEDDKSAEKEAEEETKRSEWKRRRRRETYLGEDVKEKRLDIVLKRLVIKKELCQEAKILAVHSR